MIESLIVELLDAPSLDPRRRALVVVAGAGARGPDAVNAALREVANRASAPASELLEVVLQLAPFCGFPRCLNGLTSLRRWFPDSPDGIDAMTGSDERKERGKAFFRRIYGEGTDRVLARVGELFEDLPHWIIEHAYGLVLSRPGLDPADRELAAVANLTVGGDIKQLGSHARGAWRCGASMDDVLAAGRIASALAHENREPEIIRFIERVIGNQNEE